VKCLPAAVCAAALLLVALPGPARATPASFDDSQPCGIAPRASVLVKDDNRWISYDILLLLDGVSEARAAQLVQQAGRSYTPLKIALRVEMRSVSFTGARSLGDVITAERRLLGRVPTGFDAVHTLTARDLSGGLGVVSCVGGIRSAYHALGVSEDSRGRRPTITGDTEVPIWPWGDLSGRTLAHELGHLLSGQHYLANCAEGGVTNGVASPCTLMDGSLGMSLRFSTANRLLVRKTAWAFARP
jgi:hypothetical protein